MWLRRVLLLQGLFYVLTGLWPFVHLKSFVAVVGPKPDIFQLHVTSALIVAIGAVLLTSSVARRRPDRSGVLLGVLSALVFTTLDIVYAPSLRDIYWLDAVTETAIASLLIALTRMDPRLG